MRTLNYVLHGDGTSDRMLMPILRWQMETHFPDFDLGESYCDQRLLPPLRSHALRDILPSLIQTYKCDFYFVHRDAENVGMEDREEEIARAASILTGGESSAIIPVVPVRMSEAWLLIDADAIRLAADNPAGRMRLQMPRLQDLESLPDPKADLMDLLTQASGLGSHRLRKFHPQSRIPLVSEHIRDFSHLRQLRAFQRFETLVVEQAKRMRPQAKLPRIRNDDELCK